MLGLYSVAAEPARKRLSAAKGLLRKFKEVAQMATEVAAKRAIWCIVQKVAAKALVYDVRTLEPNESMPLCQELDDVVREAALALGRPGRRGAAFPVA